MAIPTADDVFDLLEGYCIDASLLSASWLEKRRDNFIIPWVESKTGLSMSGEKTYVEYYNGDGTNSMMLNRKGVTELVKVEYVIGGDVVSDLSLVQFINIGSEGILRAIRSDLIVGSNTPVFRKGRKNIKITYKVGFDANDIPVELCEAMLYFLTEKALMIIAGRGGGGNVSVSGYSKDYGKRGKYTDIRNELARMGLALIADYMSMVTGQ